MRLIEHLWKYHTIGLVGLTEWMFSLKALKNFLEETKTISKI